MPSSKRVSTDIHLQLFSAWWQLKKMGKLSSTLQGVLWSIERELRDG